MSYHRQDELERQREQDEIDRCGCWRCVPRAEREAWPPKAQCAAFRDMLDHHGPADDPLFGHPEQSAMAAEFVRRWTEDRPAAIRWLAAAASARIDDQEERIAIYEMVGGLR